ncbi:MAG: DUF4376 domain-containing protein [Magnetospirillum sp.]|nr:DUF4376 domain-containing protein [Magnetospirillum sp.]
MARYKQVDGDLVPFTSEEEAQRDAEEAAWTVSQEQNSRMSAVPRPDRIATRRYEAEIGGTTYNGWPLATDRDSQAKVNAAYTLARDGYWSGGWKFADGVYRLLAAEQVVAMALTVSAHVQSCYAHEAALLADPEADINVGWPA